MIILIIQVIIIVLERKLLLITRQLLILDVRALFFNYLFRQSGNPCMTVFLNLGESSDMGKLYKHVQIINVSLLAMMQPTRNSSMTAGNL